VGNAPVARSELRLKLYDAVNNNNNNNDNDNNHFISLCFPLLRLTVLFLGFNHPTRRIELSPPIQ